MIRPHSGRGTLFAAIATLAWLGAAAVAVADDAAAQAASQQNVLFIIVDDLRPQLGAYGFDGAHTPNIDRLAADGLVFTHAYSQWPSCAPSRASILSGMRPQRRGSEVTQDTNSSPPSLPLHFRNHGYRTFSIGKVYNGRDDDRQAWTEAPWQTEAAGDNWQGYATDASNELRRRAWQEELRTSSDAKLYQFNARATERADLPDHAYRDGKIAARAVESLRNHAAEPFFMVVGFVKPHLPFAAPGRYWDLYDTGSLSPAENPARPVGSTAIPYNFRELQSYYGIPADMQLSEKQILELIHGYYACVSFIDAQVGKLLDQLDRLGLRENTIIVLAGDHGFHLGEQGLWGKHSLFEKALHTPLVVSVPGQGSIGRQSGALVELLDIYPSLSELAGLRPPAELEGLSFVPLINDPERDWKPAALSQYQHFSEPYRDIMGYSVRTKRYRYTEWRSPETVYARELYDFSTAAAETVNIAEDPEYSDIVEQLADRIME